MSVLDDSLSSPSLVCEMFGPATESLPLLASSTEEVAAEPAEADKLATLARQGEQAGHGITKKS